jgi:hypothetical protein
MTEAEFARQLSELSEVAKRLNAESDSINDMLLKAEAQLRALNVGISASVPLPGFRGASLDWTSTDLWDADERAHKRVWRFELSSEGRKYLLDCTRDQRIAALEALPDLVQSLTSEAISRLDTIDQAKKVIGGASMTGKTPLTGDTRLTGNTRIASSSA